MLRILVFANVKAKINRIKKTKFEHNHIRQLHIIKALPSKILFVECVHILNVCTFILKCQ